MEEGKIEREVSGRNSGWLKQPYLKTFQNLEEYDIGNANPKFIYIFINNWRKQFATY